MIDLNNFTKKVDELIYYLDDIEGNKLVREIKRSNSIGFIYGKKDLEVSYIALQFLIMPFLSDNEVADLFKNDLNVGLSINEIDLTERIKKRSVLIHNLEERDKSKEMLKNQINISQTVITKEISVDNKKMKTVSDWIKDYLANIGEVKAGTIKEAEYFTKRSNFKFLNEESAKILKKLFALYKYLSFSSLTPEGFEDDLLLQTKDGKLITTNKGEVVILYDPNKEINKFTVSQGQKISENVSQEYNEINNSLSNLESLAAKYPSGSLERLAVEEEMKKISNF